MQLPLPRTRSAALVALVVTVSAVGLVGSLAVSTQASLRSPVLLGTGSDASSPTTITRHSEGPVLRLRTRNPDASPLRVDATGLVTHLNADLVDGKHARDLMTSVQVFRAGRGGDVLDGGAL